MNNLYDVLEMCLQDLENGVELETILSRHPDLAGELRPILEASVHARARSVPHPSAEAMRRNRAKLLQRAAQLREGKTTTSVRFPFLRRWAMAFALLFLSFFSGTRLVSAASASMPGDSLYTVKRSWEDIALFFTFDEQARDALEIEYENERLEELRELFASGRSAEVDFAGIVTRQDGDVWRVANIMVSVSPQTEMPGQPIQVGAALRVYGATRADGSVSAYQIELLSPNASLPEVEYEEAESEEEKPQATARPEDEDPTETPTPKVTPSPSPTITPTVTVTSAGGINANDNDDQNINSNDDDNTNNNDNDDNSNDGNSNEDNSNDNSGGGGKDENDNNGNGD